jgi:hypothetical protein
MVINLLRILVCLLICLSVASAERFQHRKLFTADDDTRVESEYIVFFRPDVEDVPAKIAELMTLLDDDEASAVPFTTLLGMTLSNVTTADLQIILSDEQVLYAEEVQKTVEMQAPVEEAASQEPQKMEDSDKDTQWFAPWGLDRLDEDQDCGTRCTDRRYNYGYTGKDVHIYVLDT